MSTSTFVMCVGSKVFTAPVRQCLFDDRESDECPCITSVPLSSGYNIRILDSLNAKALLHSFSSIYSTQLSQNIMKSNRINLNLVVPTSMSVSQRDVLLHEIIRSNCNINVQSIHSSAAALCLAAFSTDISHAGSNILLTVEGSRGYCAWETQPCGNRQRLDMLASSDGVMRVLVAEVDEGCVNVSIAEVELHDKAGRDEDSEEHTWSCAQDSEVVRSELLTVRIMATCGSTSSGWLAADIQFTAAQLAEVYAAERGDSTLSDMEVFPAAPPVLTHDGAKSNSNSKSKSNTLSDEEEVLPPFPSGLFPVQVPGAFLQLALPRLAREITRPFLRHYLSTTSKEVRQSDDHVVCRLRRLLWFRNMELETAFVAGSLEIVATVTLEEVEQQLHTQDEHARYPSQTTTCPSSPSARLPSSIAEQLTWSPARPLTPPRKPTKQPRTSRRSTKSTSDLSKLAIPSSTRTASGTTLSSSLSVKGMMHFSSQEAENSPSTAGALQDNMHDLQEIYTSPFRSFYQKKISRQRAAGRNVHHVDDLAQEVVDLKSLLDGCIKKSLEKANVQVIGGNIGLNSPSRRRPSRTQSTGSATSNFSRTRSVDTDEQERSDLCQGWKTSCEHEDVLQPPRMILLHVSFTPAGEAPSLHAARHIASSSSSTTSSKTPGGPAQAKHGNADLVSNVLPGVFSSLYQSLQAHSSSALEEDVHHSSDATVARRESHSNKEHGSLHRKTRRSSHGGDRDSDSATATSSSTSTSREKHLTEMCRREALRNVVLAQLDDRSLLLGAHRLAAARLPSSGGRTIARIFDVPLNIGIRIIVKGSHHQESVLSRKIQGTSVDDSETVGMRQNDLARSASEGGAGAGAGAVRSRVLWVSGVPPEGCCFVQQPVVHQPSLLNINHDHFRLLDSQMKKDNSNVDDLFYDEHIEKYHPSRRLLLSDDEEDEEEEEDDDEGGVGGKNSCWRNRGSFSSVDAPAGLMVSGQEDAHADGGEECQQKVDDICNTEMNTIGIGLKSVFSGGFDNDIHLGLHFHATNTNDHAGSLEDPTENNSRNSCSSEILLNEDNLHLFPANMLWSVTEAVPEVAAEMNSKLSRNGSDDSYGSFLTEDYSDRPSWEASSSLSSGMSRHILVESMESMETEIPIMSRHCNHDELTTDNQNRNNTQTVCGNGKSHKSTKYCLEVVQYIDEPVFASQTTKKLNVSVICSMPFPEAKTTTFPSSKTYTASNNNENAAPPCSSYSLDLHIDSLSGVVSCSLYEKDAVQPEHDKVKDGDKEEEEHASTVESPDDGLYLGVMIGRVLRGVPPWRRSGRDHTTTSIRGGVGHMGGNNAVEIIAMVLVVVLCAALLYLSGFISSAEV